MSSTPQSCKKAYKELTSCILRPPEWCSEYKKARLADLNLLLGTAMATLEENSQPTNPIICPYCHDFTGAEQQWISQCCGSTLEDL